MTELKLFNVTQASKSLGFETNEGLRYYIRTGLVPAPTYVFGKRKYYTAEDMENLKRVLAVRSAIVK